MDLFDNFSGSFQPYIFTSDRGGSELLISFLLENEIECCGKIEGSGKLVALELNFKLRKKGKINSFFYSTGFDNRKVFRLLRFFKKKNIPSYCYLDSTQNLEKRFEFRNIKYLPDNVIANKTTKLDEIKKIGFRGNLHIVDDYYLKKLSQEFFPRKKSIKAGIILSDPFETQNYKRQSFSKSEIRIFTKLFNFLKSKDCKKIYFRMHPSDNLKKFETIPFKHNVILDSNTTLIKTLSKIDYAVGHLTNALAIAKKLGIESKDFTEIDN